MTSDPDLGTGGIGRSKVGLNPTNSEKKKKKKDNLRPRKYTHLSSENNTLNCHGIRRPHSVFYHLCDLERFANYFHL